MDSSWQIITHGALRDESALLGDLIAQSGLDAQARTAVSARAADLVRKIRTSARPGLMEVFLAEYGLSTDEGIALMCLAEALLRVPDAETMDALIEDKIAPGDWGRHLGRSASSMVNASTWALMLTGKVLDEGAPGVVGHLRAAMRRLGEPVIRRAVSRAMKEMGRQFVLGETIEAAMTRARILEAKGYSYSYDMLGEAARTHADAQRYHQAYGAAIIAIGRAARHGQVALNPGISIKLSALHPRYEEAQHERVMAELVPQVIELALLAKEAGLGLNIDAEEADRLALSLRVIAAVIADPRLAGWEGFGVVVQAYGRRCGPVLDWLYALAARHDRRIMVRLVKGAYWDSEIKRAQVLGLPSFAVFTRKQATDVSYIAQARKLLAMTDRIYPQFAGHNAHTVAAVLALARAEGVGPEAYEFQRLHGMGERLHDIILAEEGTRCRIYAPVGAHRDLLAYLVRRLLENGANSSFVNQIVDEEVTPEEVAACPISFVESLGPDKSNPKVPAAPMLFGARKNSQGVDLADAGDLAACEAARAPFAETPFEVHPLLAGPSAPEPARVIYHPLSGDRLLGSVQDASGTDIETALAQARPWGARAQTRAAALLRAADLYEANAGRIFALLAREAGKTLPDAVSELREAVDFLRYYAQGAADLTAPPLGIFTCISPWNFPLAIFTGQVAAALAAGNGVLAKPSEETPLIAGLAVQLLHSAGVPPEALQLLPGDGLVGAALTADPRVSGVAFTGSTETARAIRSAMARHLDPGAPLIAETGGLNAMIVDSTALLEQAVRDIIASSFQSAGQRCSALRCLYLQEDIAAPLIEMLKGAMDELRVGEPWLLSSDLGPVISAEAQASIKGYLAQAAAEGRLLHSIPVPAQGHFVAPSLLRVGAIADLPGEVFGPVLHVATFHAGAIDKVIAAINATGYGLTFGIHSRIDDRVDQIVGQIRTGNIYVNRNQIGAVVGSQPFGGEGLSGTGPKAGGPDYLTRFTAQPAPQFEGNGAAADLRAVAAALKAAAHAAPPAPEPVDLPGPTGESNRLRHLLRAPLLCLGPSPEAAREQAARLQALGGVGVHAAGLHPEDLTQLAGFSGALFWGREPEARAFALALAARRGPILPLITRLPDRGHVFLERHVCIDTTASGGNAKLLAEGAG